MINNQKNNQSIILNKINIEGRSRPSLLSNQNGLSLLEILIALTLMVLAFSIALPQMEGQRSRLEKVISNFRKSVRMVENEAILRNSISRVSIDLDATPQVYKLEYSNNKKVIIGEAVTAETQRLSISDKEKLEQKKKKFDQNFVQIEEFDESDGEVSDPVKIIGVATSLRNEFIQEGQTGIYQYSNGEKDDALIIFSTEEEVVGLAINPFTGEIEEEYVTMDANLELEDERDRISKELYEKWKKGE